MTYRNITTNQNPFNSGDYDYDRITRIITASVLGDGNLNINKGSKNAYYRTSKTNGHSDYFGWLRNVVELIVPTRTTVVPEALFRGTTSICKAQDRLESRTHPLLTDLHSLIYHDRKKVVFEKLELDAEMIAILLMDDGSRDARDGYIKICTDGFSLASVEILQEQFEAVTELHWTVFKQGNLKDGTPAYNLRLARRLVEDLAITLKPWMFPSYYHKIGLELDGVTPIPLKMRSI
jgi:hypothetical protein